jgi:hypothetical protein
MARTSRLEWARRVSDWVRSGLSCREYCERHGLNSHSMSWWKWQLGRAERESSAPVQKGGQQKGAPAGLEFVELSLRGVGGPGVDRGSRASEIRMQVGRYELGVPCGFESGQLSRLLDVLEGRGAR